MTTRWPWGDGPAPALNCSACARPIGKRRGHFIFQRAVLLCGKCADDPTAHAQRYPACDKQWHDMWDHLDCMATRAAAWFVLHTRSPHQSSGLATGRKPLQPQGNHQQVRNQL